jgi:plastocyanin
VRLVLAILVLALSPASALAANQTIQATETDPASPVWSPKDVAIDVGDTVTWSFTGAKLAHNVHATSPNWALESPDGVAQPPASFTFTAVGTYTFQCTFHDSMYGTVAVGDAPPPPLSEQPFTNDQAAPVVLELADEQRPSLTRVHASRIGRGVRVRFRVSEPARVTIRVARGRHTVKSKTVRLRRAGTGTLKIRGLRAGTYRLAILARDLADNRSRVKRARLTVR